MTAKVGSDMRIGQEEIFGPVLYGFPFRDEREVLRLAIDTRYELAAGAWTRDLAQAHPFPRDLDAGAAWINT